MSRRNPIVYFPEAVESEKGKEITYQMSLVTLGSVLKIGQPSQGSYAYISASSNAKLSSKLQGTSVVVSSILTKSDGSLIVTLRRSDGKNFLKDFITLSADLEKGLTSMEIILE